MKATWWLTITPLLEAADLPLVFIPAVNVAVREFRFYYLVSSNHFSHTEGEAAQRLSASRVLHCIISAPRESYSKWFIIGTCRWKINVGESLCNKIQQFSIPEWNTVCIFYVYCLTCVMEVLHHHGWSVINHIRWPTLASPISSLNLLFLGWKMFMQTKTCGHLFPCMKCIYNRSLHGDNVCTSRFGPLVHML